MCQWFERFDKDEKTEWHPTNKKALLLTASDIKTIRVFELLFVRFGGAFCFKLCYDFW